MSDPFRLLVPINGTTPQGEVRQHVQNKTFEAWRQAGVAMPDLYVVDRQSCIPEPVCDDGKPLTPERLAEIMKGIKPMFEPSPDGDNSKAKPTGQIYTQAFEERIIPEPLGLSALKARPTRIRIFKPVPVD